jgi:hypothetical protein
MVNLFLSSKVTTPNGTPPVRYGTLSTNSTLHKYYKIARSLNASSPTLISIMTSMAFE